jgi:hypothetical protein
MTEMQQLRKRLEDIAREITKPYSDIDILKEELSNIKKQIYELVDKVNKKDREELDNLIMLKNVIRSKIENSRGFNRKGCLYYE